MWKHLNSVKKILIKSYQITSSVQDTASKLSDESSREKAYIYILYIYIYIYIYRQIDR